MKMAAFWVAGPCRLVNAATTITLMMKAVQTSETLVHSYRSTLIYNPEDIHLYNDFI
jgi:hypothetical protein